MNHLHREKIEQRIKDDARAGQVTMTPTTRAILGRFDGRIWDALTYCEDVAAAHPALREEYTEHANAIAKVTKAGNFGYLSIAPSSGDVVWRTL